MVVVVVVVLCYIFFNNSSSTVYYNQRDLFKGSTIADHLVIFYYIRT